MYRLSNENVNNCGNSIYKLNERVEYELKFDMPLTHIFSLTSVCLSHSLPWNDNFVATIFSWNIILIYSSYFFYMTGMTFWDATKFFLNIWINFWDFYWELFLINIANYLKLLFIKNFWWAFNNIFIIKTPYTKMSLEAFLFTIFSSRMNEEWVEWVVVEEKR